MSIAACNNHQHIDFSSDALIEAALQRHEGVLSSNGALAVYTGARTGRSPKDRFIVQDALTAATVNWGPVNQPIASEVFNALWQKAEDYLAEREVFVSHLQVGADERYFLPVKVITESAWQNLFCRILFIRPTGDYARGKPHWTVLSAPELITDSAEDGTRSDGAVMLNFTARKVLLCGMRYAGEMKKALFSCLNFLLPEQDVLPMHCSANVGEKGDVALFFGLSGTGKTTLSADPKRYLIGDDEHGWSKEGVFNFEGGCYAKCIDLSEKNEPFIFHAIRRGAIMENVVLDKEGRPDYHDARYTQNTRAAYPREFIGKRVENNCGGHPQAIVFLTCDMYGILPPVALLNREQAAYYFLSGYTALMGSTEIGSAAAIAPTFSACFGAPFFPRSAQVYANLLMKRLDATGAQVYLVNTGWTGGAYGQGGHRFSIPTTRAIIDAVLSGELKSIAKQKIPGFNFEVPQSIRNVDSKVLNPRNAWATPTDYEVKAEELMEKFRHNFTKFNVSANIKNAEPK